MIFFFLNKKKFFYCFFFFFFFLNYSSLQGKIDFGNGVEKEIIDLCQRIQWLVKEEILHELLHLKPITQSILTKVESLLQSPYSFVEAPATSTMALSFVDMNQALQLFPQEFEKVRAGPCSIQHLGDHFYVQCEEEFLTLELALERPEFDTSTPEHIERNSDVQTSNMVNVNIGENLSYDEEAQANDDLIAGLGIVMGGGDHPMLNESQVEARRILPEFWLLLTFHGSYVKFYHHSKSMLSTDRFEIMKLVRKAVLDTCERVNRLILLNSLRDTHIARYNQNFLCLELFYVIFNQSLIIIVIIIILMCSYYHMFLFMFRLNLTLIIIIITTIITIITQCATHPKR